MGNFLLLDLHAKVLVFCDNVSAIVLLERMMTEPFLLERTEFCRPLADRHGAEAEAIRCYKENRKNILVLQIGTAVCKRILYYLLMYCVIITIIIIN